MDLPWDPEEDIAVYFIKLHKEQERLKIVRINWNDLQKVTQSVDEMYLSRLFGEDKISNWKGKADGDNTWTT